MYLTCIYTIFLSMNTCFNATAKPAMVWLCGPPWSPGKTAWLILSSKSYITCRIELKKSNKSLFPSIFHPSNSLERERQRETHQNLEHTHLFPLFVNLFDSLPEENHSSTRTTKWLVCCGCHNISIFKRRWNNTCSNQPANMCNVSQHNCFLLITDLSISN